MSELGHDERPLGKLEASLEKAIPGATAVLDDYYAAWSSGSPPSDDLRVGAIKDYLYNYTTKIFYPYKLLRSRSGLVRASRGQLLYEDAASLQQAAKFRAMDAAENFLRGKSRRLNASIPMRVRNEMRAAVHDVFVFYGIETDPATLKEMGATKETREELRTGARRYKMTLPELAEYQAGSISAGLAKWRLVERPAPAEEPWRFVMPGAGPQFDAKCVQCGMLFRRYRYARISTFDEELLGVPIRSDDHVFCSEPCREVNSLMSLGTTRLVAERLTVGTTTPSREPFDDLMRLFEQDRLQPESLATARARAGLDIAQSTARFLLAAPKSAPADDTIARRVLNDLQYEVWSRAVPHGGVGPHRAELALRGVDVSAVNYRQIRLKAREKVEAAKLEEFAAVATTGRHFDPAEPAPPVPAPESPESLEGGGAETARLSTLGLELLADDGSFDPADDADDRVEAEDSDEPDDEDERGWEDQTYDAVDPRS